MFQLPRDKLLDATRLGCASAYPVEELEGGGADADFSFGINELAVQVDYAKILQACLKANKGIPLPVSRFFITL
jgi:hypothetical protein